MGVFVRAAIALLLCGCVADHGFRCETNAQCGTGGACEPTGWCSFSDSTCPSGRRYGSEADPSLRGTCIGDAPDATTVVPDGPVSVPDSGGSVPDSSGPVPDARRAVPDATPIVPDAKPGAPDARPPPDATPPTDAPPAMPGPQVRVVARAWYGGSSSTVYASPGMTSTGYSIPVSGVQNGEMLLLVGSIDQGSDTVFPMPSGFNPLGEIPMTTKASGLGPQTFFAAWKVAGNEPSSYSGTYGRGNVTGSATITLLAIHGASLVTPLDEWWYQWDTTSYTTTIVGNPPVATAHQNGEALIYAMGADWSTLGGSSSSTPPPGFELVTSFGDHGDDNFDWTSMQIAWGYQATAGSTGTINGSMSGTRTGAPWAILFTISP